MKRVLKALSSIGLLTFLGISPVVHAASTCNYDTQIKLRSEANNVNANYEAGWYGTGEYEPLEMPDDEGNTEYELEEPMVKSYIYNITENLYVEVTNKKNGEIKKYTFDESENGIVKWETTADEIINYEIKIFSNHPDCYGEEIYKTTLTTPKYNNHYGMTYCIDNKEYYCAEFITQELNMTDEQVKKRAIEDEINRGTTELKEEKKDKSFLQQYGLYIGLVIVVAVTGVGIRVLLVKKKRSKTI